MPSAKWLLLAALLQLACVGQGSRYAIQWNAENQIWLSEESQVKVRNAQSRFFDGTDRAGMLEAVVTTFQDAGFQVEVLDPELGIVSGKKFLPAGSESLGTDSSYLLYDEESLVVFTRSYRTWGPFEHRDDLVRITVTVRHRNENQLIVRAAAQMRLSPIEEPLAYQRFFRALESSLFTQRELAQGG
jgi:hypothetical protein